LISLPLVNLWDKKNLVLTFALFNIKIRYKGTILGMLWTGLESLLFFVFLYVVFTSIKFTTREDFAIYLLIGIIIYHAFRKGTNGGLGSIRDNIGIASSISIRREFYPVTSATVSGILLLVEIGVFVGMMPFLGYIPSPTLLLLPIVFVLLLVLILGLSYILSVLYVIIQDIRPLWGVFVQALFFVTPIFWYLEDAGDIAFAIQKINPVGQLVELAHKLVFNEIPPLNDWLYTTGIIFGILFLGYAIFQKKERNILEKV